MLIISLDTYCFVIVLLFSSVIVRFNSAGRCVLRFIDVVDPPIKSGDDKGYSVWLVLFTVNRGASN